MTSCQEPSYRKFVWPKFLFREGRYLSVYYACCNMKRCVQRCEDNKHNPRLAYKSSFESWAGSKRNIHDVSENQARSNG